MLSLKLFSVAPGLEVSGGAKGPGSAADARPGSASTNAKNNRNARTAAVQNPDVGKGRQDFVNMFAPPVERLLGSQIECIDPVDEAMPLQEQADRSISAVPFRSCDSPATPEENPAPGAKF